MNAFRAFAYINIVVLIGLSTTSCQKHESPRSSDYLLNEAWDAENRPSIFGDLKTLSYDEISSAEFKRGRLTNQPWSDTYWPLYRAGLAWRWQFGQDAGYPRLSPEAPDYFAESNKKVEEFLAQTTDPATFDWYQASPAEKYDLLLNQTRPAENDESKLRFPFTRRELDAFIENTKEYFDQNLPWTWMGHCHGWAIAALVTTPPKHSVRALNENNEQVIFTEGDLRGLMTKAFAENDTDGTEQFLGTRCDIAPDKILRDERGRVIDGAIGTWDKEKQKFISSQQVHIELNNWRAEGFSDAGHFDDILVYRPLAGGPLKWLVTTSWVNRNHGIANVEIRDFDLGAAARGESVFNRDTPSTTAQFQYFKTCRDINAGAFHVVLSRMLSNAAETAAGQTHGFVADVTYSSEVWNHPVYGYKSNVGELTPVNTDELRAKDPFNIFRAPGTEYIAHVVTKMDYGTEVFPLVHFTRYDDMDSSKIYHYTLELDVHKNIIGGEWHGAISRPTFFVGLAKALSGDALFQALRGAIAEQLDATLDPPQHPDFLWRLPAGTKVISSCKNSYDYGCINANILYKLWECSQREETAEFDLGSKKVNAVDCGTSIFDQETVND